MAIKAIWIKQGGGISVEIRINRKHPMSRQKKQGIKYLLIALPFVAFVLAFSYIPLYSWVYAFVNYKIGHPLSSLQFVGFANFTNLIKQYHEILRVLRNTLVMSFLTILCAPLPAIFAIILNEIKSTKFKRLVQTTTTLPNFISWFVVFGLVTALFSNGGLTDSILYRFGILPAGGAGILGNGAAVWPFQLALNVWKTLGWSTIIYIAAIAGIDNELYDAAKVDGASRFQSILHVTVPGISETFLVLLLLNVGSLLSNGFDQYFAFWNSMVADKIEVLDYYIYKVGIVLNNYSSSIVLGILKTLVSILLLFTVNVIAKKVRGNSLI